MKKLPYATTPLKILIAVPSYKRPNNVETVALFDDPVLFCDTPEIDEYRKSYPETTIVEYKGAKGLTPKLNFIAEYAREKEYDAVFKVDDDFLAIAGYADGYINRSTDRAFIYQVIERMAVMARDANTPLFFTAPIADIRKYQRNNPFSLFQTLKIGAYGFFLKLPDPEHPSKLLDTELHFDERFVMKQDIDMCLQVLLRWRYVMIDNRYSFYFKPTMGSKGGVSSYRTKEKEDEMMELLRGKWGEDAFNVGTSQRASIYTLNIANPFR